MVRHIFDSEGHKFDNNLFPHLIPTAKNKTKIYVYIYIYMYTCTKISVLKCTFFHVTMYKNLRIIFSTVKGISLTTTLQLVPIFGIKCQKWTKIICIHTYMCSIFADKCIHLQTCTNKNVYSNIYSLFVCFAPSSWRHMYMTAKNKTYTHTYVMIHVSNYIRVESYTYRIMYTYNYIYVYVYALRQLVGVICIYMYMYILMYMYIYEYVYVYVYVYVYIDVHMNIQTYTACLCA